MSQGTLGQLCDSLFGSSNASTSAEPYSMPTTHHEEAAEAAPLNTVASRQRKAGRSRRTTSPPTGIAGSSSPMNAMISTLNASSSNVDPNEKSRCSQCKQDRTLDHFPVRLTSLQPYLVCKSHAWYWTEDKKEMYWAPEHTSTLDDLCNQVRTAIELASNEGANVEDTVVVGAWIVDGRVDDRAALVKGITDAGRWNESTVHQRRSRAKGPNPPPKPWHYLLRHREHTNAPVLRLVLTHHDLFQKWVITLREDTPRQAGPWAEAKRAKLAAESTPEPTSLSTDRSNHVDSQHYDASDPDLTRVKKAPPRRKRKDHVDDVENSTPAESSAAAAARSEADQRTYDMIKTLEAAIGPEATAMAMGHHQRDKAAGTNGTRRPPKRSKLQSSSNRLARSALVSGVSGQLAPRAAFAPLLSGGQFNGATGESSTAGQCQATASTSTSTSFAPPIQPHLHPHHAPHRLYPNRLTLDELLDSPFTDPPMIPLTKRVFQHHPNEPARSPTKGRVRFVDDAHPSSDAIGPEDEDDDDEELDQPDEDDEDAFEADSCEDDEGEEEYDESSEVETDEEEEEEEEGGDWLTGFVKGQLMHSGQGTGQEEVDELEEDGGNEAGSGTPAVVQGA